MNEPRIPGPEDFGKWQFVEPLLEGLKRILERDMAASLNRPTVYVNQRPDPCGQFVLPINVLLTEDYSSPPPYLILDFQGVVFGEYQSPRKLNQTYTFFLDCITGSDNAECSVIAAIRLSQAVLRILFHAKSSDFWLAESAATGVEANLSVVRMQKLPQGRDANARGIVQQFRIEFRIVLTELSDRF